MHCFTGSSTQAKQALDLGLYISFSGILTFKNSRDLQETAKQIPLERTLIETDCPFLAPVPYRGKPNEPSYLPYTAECLASLRGKPIDVIGVQTTKNAIDLFNISL